MLFDEPAASLDAEMAGEGLTVIRDLVREEGMTTLISTHEMGFVREVADTVVVFDSGDIIEAGPPEKTFTTPEHEGTSVLLSRIVRNAGENRKRSMPVPSSREWISDRTPHAR